MTGPDDSTRWDEDPVVRALRAPGTPDELAGEAAYVSAFRAAQADATSPAPAPAPAPTPLPTGGDRLRRLGRRLGGGGTAVVVTVALGAGAAAAYTQNLPEPVQRAVHGVLGPVGVPAPEKRAGDAPPTGPAQTPDDPSGSPSSDSPSEPPSASSSESPSDSPNESPSQSPTVSPSQSPSDDPSQTPTTPPAAPVAAVALDGTTHRAAPTEQVALSAAVTAADGTAVAGEEVTLLARMAGTWQPVATATSDGSGRVSVATPALARTTVFRFGVADGPTSRRWRVVLVPRLDLVSQVSPDGTALVVTADGGQPGNRVALFARRDGGLAPVGRSRLAADLTATFRVAAPSRRSTFVARLPRTRAHAAARTRLRVRPPAPRTLTASVPTDVLGPRDQTTVTGTVRGPGGVPLPGRTVRLRVRPVGGEWRRAGTAVSDASGSVALRVGPLARHTAVRLRVGAVRSPVVRLRLRPAWTASVTSGGRSAVITATALGGTAGDRVLLRTPVDGRLTTVGQGVLTGDGTVRFEVPRPEAGRVRYRLVLPRSPQHLRAVTGVRVRRSG